MPTIQYMFPPFGDKYKSHSLYSLTSNILHDIFGVYSFMTLADFIYFFYENITVDSTPKVIQQVLSL